MRARKKTQTCEKMKDVVPNEKKTFEGEKKKVCLLLKIEHTYFLHFSDIFISFTVIIEKNSDIIN